MCFPCKCVWTCNLFLMSVGQCYTNFEWGLNALGHVSHGLIQRVLWEAGMQHRQTVCACTLWA